MKPDNKIIINKSKNNKYVENLRIYIFTILYSNFGHNEQINFGYLISLFIIGYNMKYILFQLTKVSDLKNKFTLD